MDEAASDDPKTAIARLIQEARLSETGDRKRSDLFDRYMGEPYGDEQDGRSKFISTDAADVVEGLLPDLLDPFTGSENVVAFDPVGPEDEEPAQQETDVVSHVFWQQNDGFLLLYTWMKEALIAQNSYVKSCWVEKERVTIEEYEDLTPDELGHIVSQLEGDYQFEKIEGVDLQTGQPQVEGVDPQTGEPQFAPINVRIRCVKTEKKYEISCIPQEEFFITPRWPSISLDGVPCCGHRRDIERGELRRMGFSEESIARGTSGDKYDTEIEYVRHDTRDHFEGWDSTDSGDDSTQQVTVYEAYCRVDINGDGRAELVKVWAVGDGSKVLQWENGEDAIEEVSHVPFSAFTPYIVPHRHVGRSAVEQVDDIAQVKTVLIRHTLDNVYAINYARPIVDESGATDQTYNDLNNPAHGAPIRVERQDAIRYERPPSVIDTTLPILAMFDDLKEGRVGATRYNQGLDADSLNKTATGIQKIMDASMKRRQLIARIFAETGLRDLFLRIHRDLRNGPLRKLAIKLRNEWIEVNPRTWRERTDMTVAVGMGSGDRELKRQGLMLLSTAMEKMMMDPEIRGSGLVGYPQLREVAEDMLQTFGYRSIDRFLPPPEAAQPQEDKPDPQQQMAQMQMQAMQQELQMRGQEMQLKAQEAERKFALEERKIDLDHQRKLEELRLRMQAEQRQGQQAAAGVLEKTERLELDRDRAVMDDDFKRDKLEVDAATAYHRQQQMRVQSEPPMSYQDVRNGAS